MAEIASNTRDIPGHWQWRPGLQQWPLLWRPRSGCSPACWSMRWQRQTQPPAPSSWDYAKTEILKGQTTGCEPANDGVTTDYGHSSCDIPHTTHHKRLTWRLAHAEQCLAGCAAIHLYHSLPCTLQWCCCHAEQMSRQLPVCCLFSQQVIRTPSPRSQVDWINSCELSKHRDWQGRTAVAMSPRSRAALAALLASLAALEAAVARADALAKPAHARTW